MTANEKRSRKNPDTGYFKFYNANPKGKLTGDCVIRALSVAMHQDYTTTLRDLFESSVKTGYMINDRRNFSKYLKSKGWVKMGMPRKYNGKKYTGEEFCKELADYNKDYIANIGAEHVVAIINSRVYDTWNSSDRCIGNYWVRG